MPPAPRSRPWWTILLLAASLAWVPCRLAAQEPCRFEDPSIPAPTDIQCLAFSPTRNVIYFWSAVEDDTHYILEHSVNGAGDFHEQDRKPVTAFGTSQPCFDDDGLDPEEHYYYRVRSFRERDGACSPCSETVRSPRRFELPDGHFEIYYNLDGEAPPMSMERGSHPNHVAVDDEPPLEAIRRLGRVLEGVRQEYEDLGFRRPWQADPSRPLPVNVKWICNGGQYPAASIDGMAIAPEFLSAYNSVTNTGNPALFNTPFHELFHGVMQSYGGNALVESWVAEGPTDLMADLSCAWQDGVCRSLDDERFTSYYGLVQDYLGDPGRSLTDLSYPASLFWAYLCDQYGTEREGQDFLRTFLEKADEQPQLDAIQVIELTLGRLGSFRYFNDVFTEFATANYLKGFRGSGISSRYRYSDNNAALPYPNVPLLYSLNLDHQTSSGIQSASVNRWAARYIEVLPPPNQDVMVHVRIGVQTPDPVTFVRLILKGEDLIFEDSATFFLEDGTRLLHRDEKMALIVVGTDFPASFQFEINENRSPGFAIVEPSAQRPICIECGARPRFLVKVQAFDLADLSPTAGLDPGAFTFEIFGIPCTVVTATTVGREYWFVLQAPDLSRVGTNVLLALTAMHPAFTQSATAVAVVYCPPISCHSDTVLVFDRSTSMKLPTASKLASAKEAARLYIDSFETGDRFGFVSYNGSAADGRFNQPLQDWTDSSRLDAHAIIDALPAEGSTSIGAGLCEALKELDAHGRRGPWSIVLLSDGINTVDPDIALFNTDYDARLGAGKRNPVIHTVAIGADANRPDLDDLARRTQGSFHFITEPSGEGGGAQASPGSMEFHRTVSEVFRVVSEKVAGHQQVYSAAGRVAVGQPPVVHRIVADAGSSELVVAVSGDSRMNLVLQELGTKRKYAPFAATRHHTVFRVEPVAGILHDLSLSLTTVCEGCLTQVDYLVEASVRSTIGMDLLLPLPAAERTVGTPMPILVILQGLPALSRPHVTAEIIRQDTASTVAELELFDDGRHGDGSAADGLFGNTFNATHIAGDYRVEALATELTARLDPFERRRIESFHIRAGADPDGDGMPSEWEIRMGLDPTRDDAALDPDGDGWHNISELQLGTDPLDADTDDDGESDLEPWFGRDPRVAGDGVISPARIRARAGVGHVRLSFNLPRGAVSFDVLRARGSDAPFELLIDDFEPPQSLSFLDKALTNGITYRYRFISNGPNGEKSGPSNTAEATPALDPYPPHGTVRIVVGPRTPRFGEVTLRLAASDEPGEDHLLPLLGFDPTSRPSGVEEMIIARSSSFAKSPLESPVYESFAPTKTWVLHPDESGFAIVFVRFRDAAGNVSEITADGIQLREPASGGFRRGDSNADGRHDISDAISTLGYLFLGSPAALGCEKSADSNDDGEVNISDPTHLLGHLFSGSAPPPAPYPDCGADPTPDPLGCSSHPPCE